MNGKFNRLLFLIIAVISIAFIVPMTASADSVCDNVGHDYEWKYEDLFFCSVEGYRTQYCKVCGAKGEKESASMIKHSDIDSDKKCDNCKLNIVETGDVDAPMTKVDVLTDTDTYCAAFIPEVSGVYEIRADLCVVVMGRNYTEKIEERFDLYKTEVSLISGESYIICAVEADSYIVNGSGKVTVKLLSECMHNNLTETNEKLPTCIEEGMTADVYCNDCKDYILTSTDIAPLGHDMVEIESENDKTLMGCVRCDYTEYVIGDAHVHTWSAWQVIIEPTCYVQGVIVKTCNGCGAQEERQLEPYGAHFIVTLPGIDPTCTEDGKTLGQYCEYCKTVFEVQTTIPALGHEPATAGYTRMFPATMKKDGYTTYLCKICNKEFDKSVIERIDESSIRLSTEKCTYNGKTRTPSVYVEDVKGTALVKDVDYEVKYPSGRKNVGNYTITVNFCGRYEGQKNLIFTIAPGNTESCEVISVEKGAEISWQKVTGATGYRVYIYEDIDSSVRKRVVSVEGTTYTLTKDYDGNKLVDGEEYKYAIVAYSKLDDETVIHSLLESEMIFEYDYDEPEIPDDEDKEEEKPDKEDCDCKCHTKGFAKLMFRIRLLFQRIFGRNKVCACNVEHY